jgi:hypothetical protein
VFAFEVDEDEDETGVCVTSMEAALFSDTVTFPKRQVATTTIAALHAGSNESVVVLLHISEEARRTHRGLLDDAWEPRCESSRDNWAIYRQN